ncbi:MAG TPA: cytochrome c oxidase subunit II [Verrucomicrobiae bacterium]|nr:cytochrome c oxidase subunit II [Verrucomicrobiae bacterium]
MSMMKGGLRLALIAALLASGAAHGVAYEPGHWNMPVGVTEMSRTVFGLHMLIFWVCVGIAVLVFGAMFYSVFAHRKSRHPKPADFHESTAVEIAWTVVPFVILVLMAIPAAGTLVKMEDMRGSEVSIKVTGFQWKWQYEYLDQGVSFYSTLHADSNRARQLHSGIDPNSVPNYLLEVDNRLVVPTGKKLRFLITANDVIHAWWVPDLAVKKDAIPGFVNEMWAIVETPGIYRGVCAELCGRDHGFMPIVVEAVEPAKYEQWLAARKAGQPTDIGHGPARSDVAAASNVASDAVAAVPAQASSEPAAPAAASADGEKVYNAQCAACHQPTGKGMPPSFPALVGSAIVNGPAAAHIQHTLKGKNLMPPFARLSDADIAAAVTHERTSWGNQGGAVTAEQVRAQRGK